MSTTSARQELRQELDSLTPELMRSRSGVKWSRYPEPVLPAWVADMDFPVALPIRRRLEQMVRQSDFGYTWVPIPVRLIELFVERQKTRHGLELHPAGVVPTVTALQGLDAAIELFSEPGEGVVVQTPIYPPFLAAVTSCGRRLVENPLRRTGERFEMDLEQLATAPSDTRIVLLCNPHNPTGRSFSRGELMGLAELAEERDWTVIADEIHADLTYPPHRHIAFGSLAPEVLERTITITSATKSHNLAGLPCSFLATGSAEQKKRFGTLPDHLLAHPGALDIAATEAAWLEGDPWLEEVLVYLDENRELLARRLVSEAPELAHASPEATYLAWIDCNALPLPERASKLFLDRAQVALHCGHQFSDPGLGCVRLNFATSRSILEAIIDRVVALHDSLLQEGA